MPLILVDFQLRRNQQLDERMRTIADLNAPDPAPNSRRESDVPLLVHTHTRSLTAEDQSEINERYERKELRMRRYFCKEINSIAEAEKRESSIQFCRRKEFVLAQYSAVKRLEERVDITPHIRWFVVHTIFAMAVGALLNSANFDKAGQKDHTGAHIRIFFAIVLLFAFVGLKFVFLVYEILATIRQH